MPKIYEITCEICDANITNSSRVEIGAVDPYCPNLDRTLYFCGYPHMYQYLDNKRPESDEIPVASLSTALVLDEHFFEGNGPMTKHELLPAFDMLNTHCVEKINRPGMYEFRLRIVKLK